MQKAVVSFKFIVNNISALSYKSVEVDPMLATGNSMNCALDLLQEHVVAPEHTRIMCLVAAPEGVRAVRAQHPDIAIYTAALDDHLDANAYIVPGLGDAGDRLFGTK